MLLPFFFPIFGNELGRLRMVNHTHFPWKINSIIKHAALQKFQLPTAARGGERR